MPQALKETFYFCYKYPYCHFFFIYK